MHEYELVYILNPDLPEEDLTALMERVSALATNQQAEIKSQERWEKRRLAYEIKKKREGTYVVMELRASAAAVHEMDRILKITDGVLRHLITRADEAVKAKAKGTTTAVSTPPPPPPAPPAPRTEEPASAPAEEPATPPTEEAAAPPTGDAATPQAEEPATPQAEEPQASPGEETAAVPEAEATNGAEGSNGEETAATEEDQIVETES
jgi:small subunit ribosomal protein S6